MISEPEHAVEWLSLSHADARVPPAQFHPGIDEWLDIEEREQRAGVLPEVPIVVGLASTEDGPILDLRVIDFMNHPLGAATSADLTAEVLKYQLPMFFRWLATRGKMWDSATIQDYVAYRGHRTRVDRVAGATLDKDHWALSRFYGWAKDQSLIETNPIPARQPTQKGQRRQQVASKTAVSERWRWVTPGTFYLWRDVGFRGYRPRQTASGAGYELGDEDESFRGRNVQRNIAFVDLAFSAALRRNEIGTLLVTELPASVREEAPLGRSVAKQGRMRRWRSANNALAGVESYVLHSRRDAAARARRSGRYDDLNPIWVTNTKRSAKGVVLILDTGQQWAVRDIPETDRERLLRLDADGRPEPLWLWLNEDGSPMRPTSWNQVLRVANQRFSTEMARIGRCQDVAWLSPHSLRFSYGLHVLVALHRAIDKRSKPDSNIYDPSRYDLAYNIVAALMGHKSEQVTRKTYLAPLQQDRLWESAAFTDDDIAAVLEDAAMADPRVLALTAAW